MTRLPSRSASARAAPGARARPRSRASVSIHAPSPVGRGAAAPTIRPPAAVTASASRFGPGPLAEVAVDSTKATALPAREDAHRRDDRVAGLVAAGQGARVGDDGQRPAAEQDPGRQALPQLGGDARGGGLVRADVPALERCAELGRQGRAEAGHESFGEEIVVAPDVEERGDGPVARRPRGRPRRGSGLGLVGHRLDGTRGAVALDPGRSRPPWVRLPRAPAGRWQGSGAGAGRGDPIRDRTQERGRTVVRTGRSRRRPAGGYGSPHPGAVRVGRPAHPARRRRSPCRRRRSGRPARRSRRDGPSSLASGWPYGLSRPAEAIATRGRTASRNASVVAVRLPWWATLRMSTGGRPGASSDGSTSSSTSPVRRNRRSPTVPSSTTETLLIPVPPSGGSSGTAPRIGQRTSSAMSSTASRSPAAIEPLDRRLGTLQRRRQGCVARPRTAHPRLEHARDAVPSEEQRQPGDVVFVRMGQDDHVDRGGPMGAVAGRARRAADPDLAHRRRAIARRALLPRGSRRPARHRGPSAARPRRGGSQRRHRHRRRRRPG